MPRPGDIEQARQDAIGVRCLLGTNLHPPAHGQHTRDRGEALRARDAFATSAKRERSTDSQTSAGGGGIGDRAQVRPMLFEIRRPRFPLAHRHILRRSRADDLTPARLGT